MPATVSVPAGATTATFTVTTNQVSSTTSLAIIGNDNATQSATLTLTPPVLYSILMNADYCSWRNVFHRNGDAQPAGAQRRRAR